jgi:hypothetical protein
MDQMHFYWSSEADSLPALERAAKLNPDDSSVQMRLALRRRWRESAMLRLRRSSEQPRSARKVFCCKKTVRGA